MVDWRGKKKRYCSIKAEKIKLKKVYFYFYEKIHSPLLVVLIKLQREDV